MGMIIQNGILMSSSKVEIQPVIYSENEREIGVWIDGKPLYEKTFVANVTQNLFSIDVSDLHIDNVVVDDGFIVQTNGNVVYIPYGSNYNDYAISYYYNNYIKCSYAGSYNTTTWHIRIRYTKTTDIAGSGIWATTGLPAHHYSTSEQVIGTWIDGKPIYEKTFNVGSQSGADVSYNHNITNFGLLISITGRCAQPSGDHLPLPYVGLNSTSWSVALGNVTSTQFRIQKGSGIGTLSDIYVTMRYTKSSVSNTRSFSKGGSEESAEETKSEEKLEEPIEETKSEEKLEEPIEEKKLEESVDEKEA